MPVTLGNANSIIAGDEPQNQPKADSKLFQFLEDSLSFYKKASGVTQNAGDKTSETIGGWIKNALSGVTVNTNVGVKVPKIVYVLVMGVVVVLLFVAVGLFKSKRKRRR